MTSSLEQQLEALNRTRNALQTIQTSLQPYLNSLRRQQQQENIGELTEGEPAETNIAVSMALGTLRYMAARMKGCHVKSNDPLRVELDKMRDILKQVRKVNKKNNSSACSELLKKEEVSKDAKDAEHTKEEQNTFDGTKSSPGTYTNKSRQSAINITTSNRMIKAALSGSAKQLVGNVSTMSSLNTIVAKRERSPREDHPDPQRSISKDGSTTKKKKRFKS